MRIPSILLISILIASSAAGVCQSAAPGVAAGQAVSSGTIPDGTPIRMRVIRMVSSESDQSGEQVEFEVLENVTVGGVTIAAVGSSVWGKVSEARPADHGTNRPGTLEIHVDGVKLPSGQMVPLRNLKQLPMEADAEVTPEQLTNLVNSPYGPFARFTRSPEVTIPKNTPITLYVAADVPMNSAPVAAPLAQTNPDAASGTVADRVVGGGGSTRSLGDIAREQRRRGAIGNGMTSPRSSGASSN